MNHLVAMDELAQTMAPIVDKVKPHFWRLPGDEPNSLCQFLGLEEEELKSILRLCKVHQGANDNLSKGNLEEFLRRLKSRCEMDWTTFKGKCFIKLGKGVGIKPEATHDKKTGDLLEHPMLEEHCINIKTKSQKGSIPVLLLAAAQQPMPQKKQKKASRDQAPKEELLSFIGNKLKDAVQSKDKRLSHRSLRKINRIMNDFVKEQFQILLEDVTMKMKEASVVDGDETATPDAVVSDAAPIVTPPEPTCLQGVLEEEEELTTEPPPTDDFLAHLKEETTLQSLLHKRMEGNSKRVFGSEHKNGKPMKVVVPPNTQTAATFQEAARESGWVDQVLDSPDKVEGLLLCLSKKKPNVFKSVAKKRKIAAKGAELTAAQTLAMARVCNLNDHRPKKLKSLLRKVGGFAVEHKRKEIAKVDNGAGLSRTNQDVVHGKVAHEWAQTKGKEKKAPEEVEHWNSNLHHESEAETDLHTAHRFSTDDALSEVPTITHSSPGFEKDGVTMCVGGDHGDEHCPIGAKVNFSSPQARKEKKPLNYQCPMIKIASVKCSKDTHEVLEATAMPKAREQMDQLRDTAVVTVYNGKNVRQHRSFCAPKTMRSIKFGRMNQQEDDVEMTYSYGDIEQPSHGSLKNLKQFFEDANWCDVEGKIAAHQFNEVFIGDLAFLALSLGMKNSDGDHCLMCATMGSAFNCNHSNQPVRTKESLEQSLLQCLQRTRQTKEKGLKKKLANVDGVDDKGLINADPQRIIAPILHCPMGLADKALESFVDWTNLEVEDLKDPTKEGMRSVYKAAKNNCDRAEQTHNETKAELDRNEGNAELTKMVEEADTARKKAKEQRTEAKKKCDNMIQKHNALKSSLKQQFEVVFRSNKAVRECHHGGEFNGVVCTKIMEEADPIFNGTINKEDQSVDAEGFMHRATNGERSTISEDTIRTTATDCARLLQVLDSIWSKVRGVECGPLPTPQQTQELDAAIKAGKKQWLKLGLGTLQPKWHLTFDGHPLEQAIKCGGLADKADDSIEKFHQVLKTLRTRFKSIASHEVRERCIRRELRRQRCPVIAKEVARHEDPVKQAASTKRKLDAQKRQSDIRQVKKEKRDAAVAGVSQT